MQLLNLTIPQLRAATKAQIITAITNRLSNMTKREIIVWLLDNVDRIQDAPIITRRQDGQVESQTDTETDAETSQVLSTRTTTWTYYPTGEVNMITINKDGELTEIRHFRDGQQPRTPTMMDRILIGLGL